MSSRDFSSVAFQVTHSDSRSELALHSAYCAPPEQQPMCRSDTQSNR